MFKTLVIITGVFLLLTPILYFSLRNTFLRQAVSLVHNKMQAEIGMNLHIQEMHFEGLSSISFSDLSITTANQDTVYYMHELKASLSVSKLLLLRVHLDKTIMNNGFIRITDHEVAILKTYLRKRKVNSPKITTNEKSKDQDLAKMVYDFIQKVLRLVPEYMEMNQISFSLRDGNITQLVQLFSMKLESDDFRAKLGHLINGEMLYWKVNGQLNLSDFKTDLWIASGQKTRLYVPYLQEKINFQFGFDSLHLKVDEFDYNSGSLTLTGGADMHQLLMNHPKISSKDVVVPFTSFQYKFLIDKSSITLDSSSNVTVQKLRFHPYVNFTFRPDTLIGLSVIIPRTSAQYFVDALPDGLFKNIKGMEIAGEFDYRIDFRYNESNPNDLHFDSKFNKYQFGIKKYGQANIDKLNVDFVHVPYERGHPVRSIFVGPENSYYTPLSEISPFLVKSVLTNEDPSFFHHRGFIDEAFRQSILKNIRTKKFARGASTISMQLVKNVFLTREKTISRKLEEILLVYIIENNRLVSKDRMLEVYFNIIEWGPNVYGVGEATEFYFNKKPNQLTLRESLFLATIIPRPKGFMWRFDNKGITKPFAENKYRFLSNLMIRRELITPEDTVGLHISEPIPGRAKLFIKTIQDTIIPQEEFEEESILDL